MYQAKDFSGLKGIEGFSENLLNTHFKLYEGYVTNTNKLIEILESMKNKSNPEYAELKRRFGWEFNGMRLHELYFSNLSKDKKSLDENSDIYKQIVKDFGSFGNWEEDFKALGSIRGIGWVIVYYDSQNQKLFNTWINEHDLGHLSGTIPLLVMDVFEHAFILDYSLDRASYIKTFMNNINWQIVNSRIEETKNVCKI